MISDQEKKMKQSFTTTVAPELHEKPTAGLKHFSPLKHRNAV